MAKNKILESYYFDPKHPGAYAGPEKLLKVLREKYPGVFTLGSCQHVDFVVADVSR